MCTTYDYQCQYAPDDGPAAQYATDNPQIHQMSTTSNGAILAERPRALPNDQVSPAQSISNAPSPVDHGILDPVKTRYMGMHSVMAFPRTLGLDFQSSNPPRVHSFAWNCGIRPEDPEGIAHGDLRDIVSRGEFDHFAEVYFDTVHPVFSILEKKSFYEDTVRFWAEAKEPTAFEAILAGVVALGSFFSASRGHSREAEMVQHAAAILEDHSLSPSVDHVTAWILRTIYLRSITRPHRAWMASCTAMHLAEATGLHHEMDSINITLTAPPSQHLMASRKGCEQARRIFWIAWMINAMISYEYGRSSVVLQSITSKLPHPQSNPDSSIINLISVAQLVPRYVPDRNQSPDLPNTLTKLLQIPDSHPFISMSKGDLCMSLYRHARLLKQPLEKRDVQSIIIIGNNAVTASSSLAAEQKYWWNVICSVFQYVCVLLALDTSESLSNVSSAMGALDKIASDLNTHMAKEAANTAKVLLRDSMRKKRREVELLEAADKGAEIADEQMVEMADINWDALLDPW
jgi:hypothetical protein